jgi:hypothetical protein
LFSHKAEAANLTSVSDVLSDSDPSASSVHTITFTTPNGMAAGETFEVAFHADFDTSDLSDPDNDIAVTVNGNASSTDAAAGANTFGVDDLGTDTLLFTAGTGGVASSSVLVLTIGDESGNMVANPAVTTSYQIAIGGGASTMQDNGYALVAIIDNVLVTAEVQATLTFTVSGTTTGATVNGSATTTFDDSTDTTLPFGVLSAGTSKTLGQDLTVETNAANGYIVTVEQDQQLQSSTGADIDGFVDGSWDDAPAGWTSPSNSISDEDTWGHWGLTSTDFLTGRANGEFSSDTWVAASTTPTVIMGHTGPSDGETDGVGRATIGYQVEITTLQEAGDDYNTTLTYIATPTF